MIDGRGAMPGVDGESQNWDSGIDVTLERVLFFRNWAGSVAGAMCVNNPWYETCSCLVLTECQIQCCPLVFELCLLSV